jgi:hypothetical protein
MAMLSAPTGADAVSSRSCGICSSFIQSIGTGIDDCGHESVKSRRGDAREPVARLCRRRGAGISPFSTAFTQPPLRFVAIPSRLADPARAARLIISPLC